MDDQRLFSGVREHKKAMGMIQGVQGTKTEQQRTPGSFKCLRHNERRVMSRKTSRDRSCCSGIKKGKQGHEGLFRHSVSQVVVDDFII
jgi:hypothetical protein